MGEYATHRGQSIKIGTCEEMYYLRADQAAAVTAESGSVDPIKHADELRFRFPFPYEDRITPGAFEDYDRGLRLDGVSAPEGVEHYSVQFKSTNAKGYLVSLACPESGDHSHGLKIARNGFPGATFLVQQRLIDGQLWPVLRCNCGTKWRVPFEDIGPILDSLQAANEASRRRHVIAGLPEGTHDDFYLEVARRIGRGFERDYVASLGFRVAQAA